MVGNDKHVVCHVLRADEVRRSREEGSRRTVPNVIASSKGIGFRDEVLVTFNFEAWENRFCKFEDIEKENENH